MEIEKITKKIDNANSVEDILSIAKEYDIEITDEELDEISAASSVLNDTKNKLKQKIKNNVLDNAFN